MIMQHEREQRANAMSKYDRLLGFAERMKAKAKAKARAKAIKIDKCAQIPRSLQAAAKMLDERDLTLRVQEALNIRRGIAMNGSRACQSTEAKPWTCGR